MKANPLRKGKGLTPNSPPPRRTTSSRGGYGTGGSTCGSSRGSSSGRGRHLGPSKDNRQPPATQQEARIATERGRKGAQGGILGQHLMQLPGKELDSEAIVENEILVVGIVEDQIYQEPESSKRLENRKWPTSLR